MSLARFEKSLTEKKYRRNLSIIGCTILMIMLLTASPIIVNVYGTVTLLASGDTWIASNAADTNYGMGSYLKVGTNIPFRILIKFDLSSIPSDSTIDKATLYLYLDYGQSLGDPTVRTYIANRATTAWVEGDNFLGATWNEADHKVAGHATCVDWTTDGGDYTTTNSASRTGGTSGINQWFSWDVTDIVGDWVTQGDPNYGFLIKDSLETNSIRADFRSSEYEGTNPYLEIDYSPSAVGGYMAPTNKLGLLSPLLIVTGLIGAMAIASFVVKKSRI